MLRIGRISYINLYPIYYFLDNQRPGLYRFVEGVPTMLNSLLRNGSIDISPSSSIEYLMHPELYKLVPGHSISSEGEVKSIILFSRFPIEQLSGKNILYTYQSGTSVLLLEVVLRMFYKIQYKGQKESRLSLDHAMEQADAYLLIGDDALRGVKENRIYYTYDLGKLWHEHTGLPFVYALWIARKELDSELFNSFIDDLDRARDFANNNMQEIAQAYRNRTFMNKDELIEYWKGLSYDLTERHLEGLGLFKSYLKELKIL